MRGKKTATRVVKLISLYHNVKILTDFKIDVSFNVMDDSNLKKILVVDDEQETLTHLTSILQRAHYHVISTTTGKEAIKLAFDTKPDLLILDILIPDIRGWEIRHKLLENKTTAHIPVIFLTGLNTQEDERIVRESGNYHLLAKPVTSESVLEAVSKVLSEV
jgi:DNA-binding response OmpR family regulator